MGASEMAKASVQRLQSDADAAERRRSERTDVLVRVDYQSVDDLFSEFARNINEGGVFVETDAPLPIESKVSLQFKIPGSALPVAGTGRVVRVSEVDGQGPPGMGIEFDELDRDSCERINDLVRSMRTDLHRDDA
jgi:type IV pilus assembly protein PilZ